jgi:hypothetical protein
MFKYKSVFPLGRGWAMIQIDTSSYYDLLSLTRGKGKMGG